MPDTPRPTFTVGALQMRMGADADANLEHALALLDEAADAGVQVACLPELFRSLYFCQTEDHANFALAEPIPGPTTEAIAERARRHGMVVVASLFERRRAGIYHNTAAVFDADGSLLGTYRKMHIPDDPLFYEKFYFTPGDQGFRTFDTRFGRIGVLVCWDQWFPEAARLTALQGADILFYPTAIGWHPSEKEEFGATQSDAWQTVMRGHAIANGIYVCATNRFGHEGAEDGGIEFWGSSFIAGPSGQMLARAETAREEIITSTCDPALVETTRQHWPFLRDRRVDAYGGLLSHGD
jgi:N-carbamoylputrescine amidase